MEGFWDHTSSLPIGEPWTIVGLNWTCPLGHSRHSVRRKALETAAALRSVWGFHTSGSTKQSMYTLFALLVYWQIQSFRQIIVSVLWLRWALFLNVRVHEALEFCFFMLQNVQFCGIVQWKAILPKWKATFVVIKNRSIYLIHKMNKTHWMNNVLNYILLSCYLHFKDSNFSTEDELELTEFWFVFKSFFFKVSAV